MRRRIYLKFKKHMQSLVDFLKSISESFGDYYEQIEPGNCFFASYSEKIRSRILYIVNQHLIDYSETSKRNVQQFFTKSISWKQVQKLRSNTHLAFSKRTSPVPKSNIQPHVASIPDEMGTISNEHFGRLLSNNLLLLQSIVQQVNQSARFQWLTKVGAYLQMQVAIYLNTQDLKKVHKWREWKNKHRVIDWEKEKVW